jgi:hypothetical protein
LRRIQEREREDSLREVLSWLLSMRRARFPLGSGEKVRLSQHRTIGSICWRRRISQFAVFYLFIYFFLMENPASCPCFFVISIYDSRKNSLILLWNLVNWWYISYKNSYGEYLKLEFNLLKDVLLLAGQFFVNQIFCKSKYSTLLFFFLFQLSRTLTSCRRPQGCVMNLKV